MVAGRRVQGILCTHGHRRHIASALTLSDVTGADIHLHPDDYGLWHEVFPTRWPERVLLDGLTVDVGRSQLVGIHVPGHTDGGMCWYAAELGALFTGDSLSADGVGPAASSGDQARLLSAVRARLFTLPMGTTLHPGHGPDVRLGTVRWARDFWAEPGAAQPPDGGQWRWSTMRRALPTDRSMPPGATTLTAQVEPTRSLTRARDDPPEAGAATPPAPTGRPRR